MHSDKIIPRKVCEKQSSVSGGSLSISVTAEVLMLWSVKTHRSKWPESTSELFLLTVTASRMENNTELKQ